MVADSRGITEKRTQINVLPNPCIVLVGGRGRTQTPRNNSYQMLLHWHNNFRTLCLTFFFLDFVLYFFVASGVIGSLNSIKQISNSLY